MNNGASEEQNLKKLIAIFGIMAHDPFNDDINPEIVRCINILAAGIGWILTDIAEQKGIEFGKD